MRKKGKRGKCWNSQKTIFASQGNALEFIADKTTSLRPYPCEYCGGWHISHLDVREVNNHMNLKPKFLKYAK